MTYVAGAMFGAGVLGMALTFGWPGVAIILGLMVVLALIGTIRL